MRPRSPVCFVTSLCPIIWPAKDFTSSALQTKNWKNTPEQYSVWTTTQAFPDWQMDHCHSLQHSSNTSHQQNRPEQCCAPGTIADLTPLRRRQIGTKPLTSRRDPIHICRMARNAYIRVGWYGEGVLFITTPSERQLHCTCSSRSADDLPKVSRWDPDSRCRVGNPFTLAEPTASGHNRGGVSDRLMCSGH